MNILSVLTSLWVTGLACVAIGALFNKGWVVLMGGILLVAFSAILLVAHVQRWSLT